jgi:phosphoglucosamine mutase
MQKAGITVDVTDVGDRQVIERMHKIGANVGGEKSGHVILMDYATTGDGIITAMQVLRLMKKKGVPLAQLAECMTEYPQKLVSLKVKAKKPLDTLPRVMRAIAMGERDLGKGGRIIVRYSGTEEKIRLLVEAKDAKQVDFWIKELTKAVQEDLGA